jgi:hypothetical protein
MNVCESVRGVYVALMSTNWGGGSHMTAPALRGAGVKWRFKNPHTNIYDNDEVVIFSPQPFL